MTDSMRPATGDDFGLRQLAAEVASGLPDPLSMRDLLARARSPQTYDVWVKTGDLPASDFIDLGQGEGTDAAVYITLGGERATIGEYHLDKSGRDLFEEGHWDNFRITGPRIGSVQQIRIRHDNSYPFAAWYLEEVRVHHLESGLVRGFRAHRWLSRRRSDNGDCAIDITIPHGGFPIPTPGVIPDCYEEAQPSTPAGTGDYSSASQASGVALWNCHRGGHDVHVWLRDLTAGEPFEERATMGSQYDSRVECPRGDPDHVVEFATDGHAYELVLIDSASDNGLCSGANDPWEVACRLFAQAFVADSSAAAGQYAVHDE